jgi:hypothetical protein
MARDASVRYAIRGQSMLGRGVGAVAELRGVLRGALNEKIDIAQSRRWRRWIPLRAPRRTRPDLTQRQRQRAAALSEN